MGATTARCRATGRYIAFDSYAADLVPGDTNATYDVFVRDVRRGTTSRLLRSDARQIDQGGQAPSISGDGRYVTFVTRSAQIANGDDNGKVDVFVRDRRRGTPNSSAEGLLGRPADDDSGAAGISANARYVMFTSDASNIVRHDTNRRDDVFVYDRVAGKTVWSTVSATGGRGIAQPQVGGRYPDLGERALRRVRVLRSQSFQGDTNRRADLFVHDFAREDHSASERRVGRP